MSVRYFQNFSVNQKSGFIGWKIWGETCLFRSQRAERGLQLLSAPICQRGMTTNQDGAAYCEPLLWIFKKDCHFSVRYAALNSHSARPTIAATKLSSKKERGGVGAEGAKPEGVTFFFLLGVAAPTKANKSTITVEATDGGDRRQEALGRLGAGGPLCCFPWLFDLECFKY